MQYYIKIRDKAFGPFDEEQLLEMKTKGKFCKTTEVSEDKTGWVTAENLEFLFPTSPPQPTSPETYNVTLLQRDISMKNIDSSVPPELAIWFYSVNGTEGFGPVTHTTIVQMIQAGTLRGESLIWQQGQNAQQIRAVQTFTEYFSSSTMPSSYQQQTGFQPENASLFCSSCGQPVVQTAQICPRCGSPIIRHNNISTMFTGQGTKSRLIYILLALFFFGTFGSHNFYAERTKQATIQLVLGLTVIGLLATSFWAILDAITVTKDGSGHDFV
ncbi:MAG: GYF domain-containing protein [Planctomycetaceae bacterium]|jgi:TM2 domain-containing membrane protein YozV|nr:GYF domain-containing protein [Planctomycetaceae bacterium]